MRNDNVNYTKQLIADTFIDLMKKRSVSDISISELCEQCKISRRTFYNHFPDKNAIVEHIYIELYHSSWYCAGELCSYADFLENIYQYSIALGDYFPASFEYTGQNNIRNIMYEAALQGMLKLIELNGYKDEIDSDVLNMASFVCLGMIGYAEKILMCRKNGMSNEESAKQFILGKNQLIFVPEPIKHLLTTKKQIG